MRRFVVGALAWAIVGGASAQGIEVKMGSTAYDQGVVIRFPEAMQVMDSRDVSRLVRMTPAATPPLCYWVDDATARCNFEKKLPLATQFRITLDPALLQTVSGTTLQAAPFLVESPRPSLMVRVRGWEQGRPRLLVWSQHNVTEAAVRAALRVRVDGKPVPFGMKPIVDKMPDTEFELDLPETPRDGARESTLTIDVVPGLRSNDGPLPGTEAKTLLRAVLDEPFQVRGLACAGATAPLAAKVIEGRLAIDGCIPGEAIRLHFSREPVESERKAWMAQWPAGMTVRAIGEEEDWRRQVGADRNEAQRGPGWWVEFEVAKPNADVTLPVPALHAHESAGVLQPVVAHIGTGKPRPSFIAPYDAALLLPGTPIPVDVVNAPPQLIRIAGVARDEDAELLRTPAAGDAPVAIRSDVAERALREGGYTAWSPEWSTGDFRPAFHAAAPQFDVFTVVGDREVLAWAHDWDTGAPIADAKVELLLQRDGRDTHVAMARTDDDGKALLVLPADFERPVIPESEKRRDPMRWTVRAEHRAKGKTRRAVLPIMLAADGNDGLGGRVRSGFGITDRPLYRAGDTVQWRVWLLQRQGKAMVPRRDVSTVRLGLSEQYGNALLEWEATPDAHGAIAGSTVIPIHAPDGEYCIGESGRTGKGMACFYVGAWHAQDLWMRASSPSQLVRDGESVTLDLEAGYYSGGAAAGAAIDRIAADVYPATLDAVYPQWRGYAFARAEDDEFLQVAGTESLKASADAQGRARVAVPVAFGKTSGEPPPFGALLVTAAVKLSDRGDTISNVLKVPYARHARYVGLKLEPAWLDSTSPVRMQGVVVDAHGREVPGARVDVEVAYAKAHDGDPVPVTRCTLEAGQLRECAFDRRKNGVYTLTARSGDAAPAQIAQYVWSSPEAEEADETVTPNLDLVGEAGVIGTPVRLLLEQPGGDVPALLVVTSDGAILESRVIRAQAGTSVLDVSTRADWPRNLDVNVFVRGGSRDARPAAGFRQPVPVHELSVPLDFKAAPRKDVPVTVAFEPNRTAPAETARVVLHNTTRAPRTVTLGVVDDALRALGKDFLTEMDPAQSSVFEGTSWESTSTFGFSDWNRQRWRWLIRGPRDICAPRSVAPNDCTIVVVGAGAINPIDISSVESIDILTAEQLAQIPMSRDTTNVALLAPSTVVGAGELSSVEVVGGSAFELPGSEELPVVFDEASPGDASKPETAASPRPPRPDARAALDLARVRTHFADTALWRTDIVLAPGERREVEFTAPDNLTRWRAVAWSEDGAGDFAMAEATLEAGLPVEARLQSPVRIYAGDRARLAANVRHTAKEAVEAQVTLDIRRADAVDANPATLALPAQGQASFATQLQPEQPGLLIVTAAAATPEGRDAVAAPLEVASTTIAAQRTQAGWIDGTPLSLALPTLPEGATDPRLAVSLWRGNDALAHGWTEDMREYPHRCWEQILSRAVAAALALERKDPSWPDARAVVREALDNAAVFQRYDGNMQFFAQLPAFAHQDTPQVALTAWTLDALAFLRSLGHAFPDGVERRARAFLATGHKFQKHETNERAIAAAVVDRARDLPETWAEFPKLALPARVAAARAFARGDDPHASEAFQSLLADAPLRAGRRVLDYTGRADRWMSSPMREQCELIRLLQDFPQHAPTGARQELVRGLSDLYAGGVPEVDTQTGAACLRALHGERASDAKAVAVDLTLGATSQRIALESGAPRAAASFETPATGTLQIAAVEAPQAPVAYLARVDFNEDAREAQATAIGFAIERRYEVLRQHKWTAVGDAPLQEGDWIRVTLTVTNARLRHFVAVTDDLPGGLRPMDLQLAGVAGVDVQALGELGDRAFDQRKLDARKPKFYAEVLPAGSHAIHYFARVANTGDYLAAPALAELMYGEATRARTASDRLRIEDPAPR